MWAAVSAAGSILRSRRTPARWRSAKASSIGSRPAWKQPVAGKRELPYNRIAVTVLAVNRPAREHLQIVLDDLEPAIRARLAEMRCTLPFGCAVDVRYITKRRADWAPEQHFTVELDSRAPAGGAATRQIAVPALLLTVIRGQATERFYRFTESQVLIGRTPSPTDHTGRPRHNHVVFLDEGDEHNGTVGRAHASIRFEADRLQVPVV